MIKPTDSSRLDFLREFRASLAWSAEYGLWKAETEAGQAVMMKTPRRALDELMRLTRRGTKGGRKC